MFKRFWNWIKELLDNKEKYLRISVNVVQAVKKAINSNTFSVVKDIAKALLPDTGDAILDKAVAFAEKEVPILCLQLEIMEANEEHDAEEALKALSETYGEKWGVFMSSLAGRIAEIVSDGKIDPRESRELAKEYYDKNIKDGTT